MDAEFPAVPASNAEPEARLTTQAVTTIRGIWSFGTLTYLGAFLGTAVGLGSPQVGLASSLAGGAYVVGSATAGGRLGTVSPQRVVATATAAAGAVLGRSVIAFAGYGALGVGVVLCAV